MAFPNTHFLAYADDMGMSVLHAANTISATAIFSIVGGVLLGLAADRFRRTSVLALTYALRGLAFLLLLLLPAGNLLYVYGLVLGISWTPRPRLPPSQPIDTDRSISVSSSAPLHLHESRLRIRVLPRRGDLRGDWRLPGRLIVNVALIAAAIAAALVPQFGHERQRRPSAVTAPETSSLPARASG